MKKDTNSSFWAADEETKKKSNLENFCRLLDNKKYLKYSSNFSNLWKWSVKKPEIFWSEVWDFTKIKGLKGKIVIKKNKIFFKNQFFPDSKLNYTDNLLVKKNNEVALKFLSENNIEKELTWNKLYENVCKFSYYLKKINLKEKDRVAAYVPNTIETVISFLSTAKNGLI